MIRFGEEIIHIQNLRVECIVGVKPEERVTPQPLIVSASFRGDFTRAAESDDLADTLDYGLVAQEIRAYLEHSRFQLLETLARRLAEHLSERFALRHVALHIRKPAALAGSDGPAVSLTLTRDDPPQP